MASAKEYSKLLDYWKPRLGLSDWEIRFEAKHPHDMRSEAQGSCYVTRSRRIAYIEVAEPQAKEHDVEQTVVHELLHCYFDLQDFDAKDYAYVQSETGVDAIACLLVKMRRENELVRTKAPRKPDRRRKPTKKGSRDNP